jgi:serine/threonine-protein kinase
VPDIDPLLEEIVLRAMRKDRVERQQTARELRNELRQLLEPVFTDDEPPSIRSISVLRKEVREALPGLDQESVRFQEFFVALAGAISRTTYYERGHKESMHALDKLVDVAQHVLRYRGEISFARRDVGETVVFSVLSGIGEVFELKKLVPSTIHQMFGTKFGEVFQRRSIVALTIEDGIGVSELASMVDLLSGPEISAEQLRTQFVSKGMSHAKLLFASDLLGRERRLPWQVDVCISRLARDLRSLPLLRGIGLEGMLQLRLQLIADVVRALPRPEQVRILLENADLIADEVRHVPELAKYDTLHGLIDALPRVRAASVAELLIKDGAGERSHRVLDGLTQRFVRDRSPESDEILKKMHAKGALALEMLPEDLQAWVHGERQADLLVQRPDHVLRPLEGQIEASRFRQQMALLERSCTTLAERGEARALSIVLAWLRRLQGPRAEMAGAVVRSLEDPALLEPIARVLFTGVGDSRDAALAVLVLLGSTGARALYMARTRGELDGGARARFVATMRRIGRAAWPTLIAAIERVVPMQGTELDAGLAEDLIRALPEVQDEQVGANVAKLIRIGHGAVVRAGVTALATLWQQRARPLLVAVLDNEDEGVKIAALTALRKVGGIDEHVIGRIEKMVGKGTVDLRAAAAAALADAPSPIRDRAIAVLRRALVPQTKGVMAMLRGAERTVDQEPLVVLALARAVLAIGARAGIEAVEARAAYAEEPLRSQLRELLPRR